MTVLIEDPLPTPTPASAGGGAIATYVSLFMILFVFFIVLFSIASQQRARSLAVLASLDAAFGHLPSAVGLIPAPRGDAILEDPTTIQFVADIGTSLAEILPGSHPAGPPRSGTVLNLDLPPETLFEPGTPALKPAALPALNRLAVILQRHRGGARFGVSLAATTAPAPAADRALATARVTALAAHLFARGCPADAVTVAVTAGANTSIRLDFLASTSDETDN
jgi:hypothetical protein